MYLKSILLVSLLLGVAFASDVDLTDDTFESGVSEVETTLVMFYAPW